MTTAKESIGRLAAGSNWVLGGLRQWFSGHKAELFLRGQFVKVPLDRCVNFLAFSFAPTGWHYYTATLQEYRDTGRLPLPKTILYRYHQSYQPTTLSTILPPSSLQPAFNPRIGIYPWGSDKVALAATGGRPLDLQQSHGAGPSEDVLIEKDYAHIINLYHWIRRIGYHPWLLADGFIHGTYLLKENGDWRFLVNGGNHRCAVLSVLGYRTILARQSPQYVLAIREQDVESWHYVRSGACSRNDALHYFNAYFDNSGYERAFQLCEENSEAHDSRHALGGRNQATTT